jgi:hypothetical protein
MKKTLNKKLSLNKETIASLNDLGKIIGGLPPDYTDGCGPGFSIIGTYCCGGDPTGSDTCPTGLIRCA